MLILSGRAIAGDYQQGAPPAEEEAKKKPFTVGADLDFLSRYVWRGLLWSDGPVFQPDVWISSHGFTFTVWGNIDLTDEPDRNSFNEVDFYFVYEGTFKKITLEPSINVWYYPSQLDSPTTAEFDLKVSYPIGPISLYTTQSVDIVQYQGAYFGDFGLFYEKEFFPNFSLETFASVGWANGRFNEVYVGIDKAALNVFTYNLTLYYYPVDFFFLKPHVEVTTLLNNSLKRALIGNPTQVAAGMAFGFEF